MLAAIKKYTKRLFLISICMLTLQCSNAQLQNRIWWFGDYGGINFSTSPPTPAFTPVGSPLYAPEAAATYCDPVTGQLKLFTNSVEIIDRNGNNIQGSGALAGATTATQTVIVPKPGSSSLVYVFTVHGFAGLWIGGGLGGGLNYTIIDLSLNGGLGAAVSTDVFLTGPTTEKLVAVKGCTGKDYWIVSHLWNSNAFYSYHLTDTGLNPIPVISNVGAVHANSGGPNPGYEAIGQMKISRDYKKLAVAIGKGIQRFELFNFDNATGQVGSLIFSDNSFPMFNGLQSLYGCEFSPDGSKLYLSEETQNFEYIFQYNLSSGVPATMLATRTLVLNQGFATSYGGLQLGPDGRIYVAKGESTLDVVRNPNAAGAACNYQVDGFAMAGFGTAILGLPNLVDIDIPVPETASLSWRGCGVNTQALSFINGPWPLPITSFSWNFGDTISGAQNFSSIRNPQHTFSANGSYTVRLIVGYGCVYDTLVQTINVANCPITTITGIKISGDTCNASAAIAFQAEGISSSPYFFWNFNDPASGTNDTITITGLSPSPFPVHTFSAPGIYNVCVSLQEPGSPVSQVCRRVTIGLCCNGITTFSTTTQSVCSNQLPYTWNGTAYNAAGTFTKTLVNAVGCDSIATLVLTVKQNSSSITNQSICNNQFPYTWNGTAYNAAGTFTKTLINAAGCDSIATLVLTVKQNSFSITNQSICSDQFPYTWNGTAYNAAGTFTKRLINTVGCDSVATLNLTVSNTLNSTTSQTVCRNQLPYLWNGQVCNAAGSYTVKLASYQGCDSIASLILTVAGVPIKPLLGKDTSLCPGTSIILNAGLHNSYTWQDLSVSPTFTVTEPGIYTVAVNNAFGCSNYDTISIGRSAYCDDIFFPSAISPGGNPTNRTFGALGNLAGVKDYHLSIYNRYGQVVFSTSNPFQKWDARYKGIETGNFTFVWYASYTINRGNKRFQKGTLLVVR